MTKLTQQAAWAQLQAQTKQLPHMRALFNADPKRFDKMSLSACGLLLDYSKNRADEQTLALLFDLAKTAGLSEKIRAMFNGEIINNTEKRAVLHTALRAEADEVILVDGQISSPR